MKNFNHILSNLLKDESGQDLVEYALITAMIAGVAVAVIPTITGSITNIFNKLHDSLTNAYNAV